jgi:hypothetical protein
MGRGETGSSHPQLFHKTQGENLMKIQKMAPMRGALAMAMATLPMADIALAAPGLKIDQPDISSKQCTPGGSGAQQLVDVHFTILNVADSGFGPSGSLAWANDTIDRCASTNPTALPRRNVADLGGSRPMPRHVRRGDFDSRRQHQGRTRGGHA